MAKLERLLGITASTRVLDVGGTRANWDLLAVRPKVTILNLPRALEAGEQYRFHFDMTQCIGCKCCVVACNEQNGNPAELNWRRVGEVEGGY